MLNKDVSSTIFKVFAMTQPRIEPRSSGPLANTLHTRPINWHQKNCLTVPKSQLSVRQLFFVFNGQRIYLTFHLSTHFIEHNDETEHFVKHIFRHLLPLIISNHTAVCILHSTNFEKGMNPTILPPALPSITSHSALGFHKYIQIHVNYSYFMGLLDE